MRSRCRKCRQREFLGHRGKELALPGTFDIQPALVAHRVHISTVAPDIYLETDEDLVRSRLSSCRQSIGEAIIGQAPQLDSQIGQVAVDLYREAEEREAISEHLPPNLIPSLQGVNRTL